MGLPMSVTAPQSNGKVPLHEGPKAGRAAPAPGSRLAEAFEAVERYPVLVEARDRVINAATAETARAGEIIEAVESDVALAVSVLRNANRTGLHAGGIASIPTAVEMLKPPGVLAIAGTAPSFDFFEPNGGWELKPERFRVHALATQRAADRIGRVVGWVERDELAVAALLHDIGRLVISRLHPGYKVYFDAVSRTPEQRLREEREQLGIDHALVGGVLARRWNLPQRLAIAIERHHSDDAEGLAAMVATADMVAHYCQGEAIAPERSATPPSATSSTSCRCRPRTRPGSASPAPCRPESSMSSATSPRAWSTSRSRPRCTSRSRRSAPTSTTSTARSAPSTAPRPCSRLAIEAGSEMSKASAASAVPAVQPKQAAPKWRRRSLVRVRRPSWAANDQRPVSR
jgi:putative nucleotidyltransferase with HDIG domain